METLIKNSTAYKIFCREAEAGRLAHAYMLSYEDGQNMRAALKVFALRYFGAQANSPAGLRILHESYPDCRIFPEPDKKFNTEAATKLIEDCALRPVEADKKLYVICGFEECSSAVQNKLLKVVEEPPDGVAFLLGATTLASVLPTIISRVRLLEVAPFSADDIYRALERADAGNPLNRGAAESCGGVLGVAQSLAGGAYQEVRSAALEILSATDSGRAGEISLKYADCKYKKQVLAQCQRMMSTAARAAACGGEYERQLTNVWSLPALICGAEQYGCAMRDLKFNAYFSALLYGVMLKVIEENDRWQRLSE